MNTVINEELYKLWENTHLPLLEEIINKEMINTKILRKEISKLVEGWMKEIEEINLIFLFNVNVNCSSYNICIFKTAFSFLSSH
jgi:hypothetical protein